MKPLVIKGWLHFNSTNLKYVYWTWIFISYEFQQSVQKGNGWDNWIFISDRTTRVSFFVRPFLWPFPSLCQQTLFSVCIHSSKAPVPLRVWIFSEGDDKVSKSLAVGVVLRWRRASKKANNDERNRGRKCPTKLRWITLSRRGLCCWYKEMTVRFVGVRALHCRFTTRVERVLVLWYPTYARYH